MFAGRRFCGLAFGGALFLLGGAAAHAGSQSIVTGAVLVAVDDMVNCTVVNGSDRTISGVSIVVRRPDGTAHATASPADVEARHIRSIAFTEDDMTASLYCEVTSEQGTKSLRATFTNRTSGVWSEAR